MFVARYLDIFTGFYVSLYNIVMKVFYILGSFATVFIILLAFWTTASTPSEKRIVRIIVSTVLPSFVLAMAFHYGDSSNFTEIWWAFSIYLGAVADIPQLVEYYHSEERHHPDGISRRTVKFRASLRIAQRSNIFQARILFSHLFAMGMSGKHRRRFGHTSV